MAETQTESSGGEGGGVAVATASPYPDDIRAIGDQIAGLTLKQAVGLRTYLADNYGIEAAETGGGHVVVPTQIVEEAKPTQEPAFFNVVLKGFDPEKKMAVIKEIRAVTSLGLADAKAAVEGSGTKPLQLKDNLPKVEAEALKAKLEGIGAKIELT